ncbi:InlB B-repeat-containing protein [uncultured Ruminococcus sp.]|uniref:InlB B-repeat-containing protein n=1 Tax=uncultured Ruminococcus sp. TaxID=165186 RepID=UPI0025CE3FE7|nr:InlB B-repeat-containing protein [uncultured Ruminococcus sp.]
MKKRILSILLTLCMTLCLTPISVFAEEVGAEGSASVQLGTTALNKNVNTATAPTVYFGQDHENNLAAWRVIGYDGSGVTSAQGDITLLAAGAMGVIPFADIILYNEYAPSNLKTAIDALAAKLTTEENAAVKKRALTSGSYNGENTDCVAGGQVDNAVFWPLSTKEAIAVNNDLRALDPAHPNWVESSWWLRSPGSKTFYVAIVSSDGSVKYSGISIRKQNNHLTARPAFNLNLNSVLFTSAAVGGKPDGGLTAVPEYSGNEWKLTLLDSSRNFAVTEKAVSADPNDTITLNYSGATTGANEYISAIIADSSGAQYYGRVAQPTAESGTVEIKIPSDIAPGNYTLKVFSEQYNGDYKTDYASNFTDIALTVEKQVEEQFSLTPGGRYYFDLSAMKIPGTANGDLPDSTLHYVPFTYAGTVDAYKLTSEMATTEEYAQREKYPHSLFVADYAVTLKVNWNNLDTASLIFGKNYASGGVDYTLRAPSVGSDFTGSDDSQRGEPQSNEWDTMLNKNSGYIQNWNKMYSWGQDTFSGNASGRAVRGYLSARFWSYNYATTPTPNLGFRPVLEVLNSDTLGSGGLKVVTLDLGGGTLGGSSEDIQIIVKTGSEFTAPASDGMTRPDGNTGSYFMWLGSNGKLYAPGDRVPADVTALTVQWTAPTYAVTLNTNGGTINKGNVTGYTYGVGATLPTADDMTYTGYMFKGWYDNENLTGSPVTAIGGTETGNKEYWAKWEINQYTITFDTNGGSEIAPITQDYGTAITAPADPTRKGYTFKGWDKEIPKTMPAENIMVKAQWEINQYAITFDTNGGSEIAPITQDYGTAITAPADPTRKGYTFKGWDREIPKTMPAENMTVKAQWEINQYTITFDTNGGSEIAPITQDYGTAITAPADPTRKGYTFKGWDKEIPKTMPAENIMVKAQWEINQYAITFDTNGGSEIAPITQDYGTAITAPADPTRKGYTFKGWDKEIPKTMPAENITVKAQWEINQYTITFDTNGGSEIAPITQNYGTKITAPADPTRKGYTFKGWDKEIPETMPAENITITARWRDTERPTGEIIIGTNKWNKFLNELTFGIFFKDTQEVTINAVDNSGTVFVSYLVTDKDLSEAELDSLVFRAYEEPFCIDPNGEYIVYVMLVDENINITYLRSDRLTLDNIHPVIGGIEDGKIYCEAQM